MKHPPQNQEEEPPSTHPVCAFARYISTLTAMVAEVTGCREPDSMVSIRIVRGTGGNRYLALFQGDETK